ncbi:MAG: hypothetical protein BWY76_02065 [bacterium ADurb.Bin429]|nr:MAG: hypothetical protein BWY76_02065 [bacterium ADurb.Bin429]
MQRGARDHRAGQRHRVHDSHRGEGAGAAHLRNDVAHEGFRLLRGVFVGDGPARAARDETQRRLRVQIVHLHHHSINVVAQRVARRLPGVAEFQHLLRARRQPEMRIHRQAGIADEGEQLSMRVESEVTALAQRVAEDGEFARGCYAGIELAHRAGGGVARIGEGRFAALLTLSVDAVELGAGEVHLAANLDDAAQVGNRAQPQRHGGDGADIPRDVLALHPVAAGGGGDQRAVHVGERHREAVNLQFADIGHIRLRLQPALHPAVKIEELLVPEGVAQREHRRAVAHGTELLRRRRSHPLRGRRRRHQLRMRRLQRLQLAQQRIVLRIRYLRRVQHVIPVIMPFDFGPQVLGAGGGSGIGIEEVDFVGHQCDPRMSEVTSR